MQRGFCLMWLATSSVMVVLAGTAGLGPVARAAEPAMALPPPSARGNGNRLAPSFSDPAQIGPTTSMATGQAEPANAKPKKWLSWPKLPWSGTASPNSQKAAPSETKAAKGLSTEQQKLEGQVSIARLAERRGQTEQAELAYQSLLKKHPELVTPHHRLGVLAARRGQFDKANEHFQAALRSDSKNVELLNDAGYCYYLQNRLDEAEQLYQKALTLDPNNQAVCNNVAMFLADKGRFDESLAIFQRVNSEAQAHTNLAFMLTQTGQYEQAEAHFTRALTLDSTLRPAAKGLLQLAEQQNRAKLAALPPQGAPRTTLAPTADPARQLATGDNRARLIPAASEPARQIRLTSQETAATEPAATRITPAAGAGLMNQGAQPTVLASPDRTPAPAPDRFANGVLLSAREDTAPPVASQVVPAPRWLEAENVSRPKRVTVPAEDTPARSAETNRRGVHARPETTGGAPRASRYAAGQADSATPQNTVAGSPPSEPRTAGRQTVNSRLSDRDESGATTLANSAPATRGVAAGSPWPPPPDMNLGRMNPSQFTQTGPLASPGSTAPLGFGNAMGPGWVTPTTPSVPTVPNWWGGTLAPVNR